MAGMPDAEHLIAGVAGPTASTVARGVEGAAKFVAGEYRDPATSRLAEDIARRVLPLVGPTAAEGIREKRKRKNQSPLSLPGIRLPSVLGNQY